MTNITILSRQVTAYHHARFRAAGQLFDSVDILSLANQGKFAEILSQRSEEGYRLHRVFPDLDAYRRAALDGSAAAAIQTLLDKLDPEVVAIAGWASAESYAALTWAKSKRRSVVLMSDSQAHDVSRNALRDWIKGRVVRCCDAGLAAGRSHRDYLVQLGLPRNQVRLGYDAVDNAHFSSGAEAARADAKATRGRLGLPESYILASARFIEKKNLLCLVEAYCRAREGLLEPPDLLIAGDGDGRAMLEHSVERLGLTDFVHLPGFYGYDDMPALYALSSGFVHVPQSEQWGLVVNEAASSGLPMVLSAECGAATELLQEGQNGWLCPATDCDAIAMAVREMLCLSPDRSAEMGQASREIVADWGPERFANELAEAARIAILAQRKPLSLIDRKIVRYMSQKVIEAVA